MILSSSVEAVSRMIHILSECNTDKIFKYTISLYDWHKNELIPKLDFQGINILGLFDTSEFHNLLAREIYRFITIKRILESLKFTKLKANPHSSSIIKLIQNNSMKQSKTHLLTFQFVLKNTLYQLVLMERIYQFKFPEKNMNP